MYHRTHTSLGSHVAFFLATWTALLTLTGVNCPQCDIGESARVDLIRLTLMATQAAAPAVPMGMPSCHESTPPQSKPATTHSTSPANPAPYPAVDCDCTGCKSSIRVVPSSMPDWNRDAEPQLARALPMRLHAVRLAPLTVRGHYEWVPPPYPGFLENTVILLN